MKSNNAKKGFALRTACFFLAVFALFLFAGGQAWSEQKKVVVIPFKMNADQDLGYLRDGIFDMLSTRLTHPGEVEVVPMEQTLRAVEGLSGPINEGYARNAGAKLDADYVLYGSLTVFGNSVSIDAKSVDMSGLKPPVAFFNQSQGMDEVIPRINEFAARINSEVFGKQTAGYGPTPAAAPGTSASAPQAAPTQSIYAHPERMWEQEMGGQAAIEGGGGPFIVNRPGDASGFRKSQNFDFQIESITVGDLTSDGVNEVVLMASQALFVYRNQNGRLTQLKELRGEKYHSYISVDAADIKENGKAEIFVTCLNDNTKSLDSFVLEWNGSDFDYVSKGDKWYFQTIQHPEMGKILAGQKRGILDLFSPGVYRLSWDGQGYVDTDKLPVPRDQIVYGFAMGDPLNEGGNMVVSMDSQGYLRIFTAGGGVEWKSEEKFGGSEKALREMDANRQETESRMFLPQRVLLLDSNKDGKTEVLVIKNEAFTGTLFKNYRHFGKGAFQALTWDGLGLTPFWQTRQITGYVSDYDLADMNGDGVEDLVASVVTKRDMVFRSAKSAIIFYDLSLFADSKSAESSR